MSKTSTESKTSIGSVRHALNGATMGTRWSALFFAAAGFDPTPLQNALQLAVNDVDHQMSTWNPDSDLMRLNRAPEDKSIEVPAQLAHVLALGLKIGRASGGAFDIGMGDAVRAWGFGPDAANTPGIEAALKRVRRPAYDLIEIDGNRVLKKQAITIDLNGIAKGWGVDRLAETLADHGIHSGLVGIDGEVRALGLRPDGEPWAIAVEAPETDCRMPHSLLSLQDAAVATSGDYRHWVTVQGRRLSHTMDPMRGAPLTSSPASVSVVASTCAEADAWATALMVLGPTAGSELLSRLGLSALFLMRDQAGGIQSTGFGSLFKESEQFFSSQFVRWQPKNQ